MSELSSLFTKAPIHTLPPQSARNSHINKSVRTFAFTQQKRNIDHRIANRPIDKFEDVYRKCAKKQLARTQVKQELRIFNIKIAKMVVIKITIILMMIMALGFLSKTITSNNCFFLIFYAFAILLPTQSIPLVDDPAVRLFISICHPLTYCAANYTLLRSIAGVTGGVNWALTFLSLWGLLNYGLMLVYKPIYNLNNLQTRQPVQTSPLISKPLHLLKTIFSTITHLKDLSSYIIITNIILTIILVIVNIRTKIFSQLVEQGFDYYWIFYEIGVWFGLCIFYQFVGFIDRCVVEEMRVLSQGQKMPVFMVLLRMAHTSDNTKILRDCLTALNIKMTKKTQFLMTQTSKSFIYNTYMDIFTQYAITALSTLHCSYSSHHSQLLDNKKIIQSSKSIKQDLFISLRQIKALFINQYHSLQIINQYCKIYDLMRIIQRIGNEQRDQEGSRLQINRSIAIKIKDIKEKYFQTVQKHRFSQLLNISLLRINMMLQAILTSINNGHPSLSKFHLPTN